MLDRHLTILKMKKKAALEAKKQEELAQNEELDSHIDDVFEKYKQDTDSSGQKENDENKPEL